MGRGRNVMFAESEQPLHRDSAFTRGFPPEDESEQPRGSDNMEKHLQDFSEQPREVGEAVPVTLLDQNGVRYVPESTLIGLAERIDSWRRKEDDRLTHRQHQELIELRDSIRAKVKGYDD